MRTVTLTRRVTFSAGHRYWREEASPEENRRLFGKWASPYHHGHNYVLYVSATGPVDPVHGMVVNIKRIDDVLKERVVGRLDQRSLTEEIPAFRERPASLENLLLFLARELRELPGGVRLTGLELHETETLYAAWQPEDIVTLTRIYEFAAAHRLHVPSLSPEENLALFGKCNHPHGHGHNYVLEVTVEGDPDPVTGMLCDLEALDRVVEEEILERYDHRNLDVDVPELQGKNTTSEMVALAIFDRLRDKLPAKLARIRLFETARNVFEVRA